MEWVEAGTLTVFKGHLDSQVYISLKKGLFKDAAWPDELLQLFVSMDRYIDRKV